MGADEGIIVKSRQGLTTFGAGLAADELRYELLTVADAAGFEVLVTTDRNLRYQQNLARRKIAIVVLGKGRWSIIKPQVSEVIDAVNAATPGSCVEIGIAE